LFRGLVGSEMCIRDRDSNGENYRNGYSEKTLKTQHGEIAIDVPRDRSGSFEPMIVGKHQRRGTVIDNAVISLYSKGMSLNQIVEHIKELYQIEMSDEQISSITQSVMEEVTKWQTRPLSSIYPIVYMDGIYINVLENKTVIKKVVYVVLGVNLKGQKELLGLWIADSEGSKFWLNVLTELNSRGLKQICIACVDGLTGFPDAIHSIYPKAMVQQCIVHAVRRSLDYVSHKDRKAFAAEMKLVYGARTIEDAANALDDLELTWGDKYPA
jgi:putative transposase